MSRDATAQRPPRPGVDLTNFPKRIVKARTRWHRAHHREKGPWYFAFKGEGRFDLKEPFGSCYLASTPEAAAREIVGPEFSDSGRVPETLVNERIVSQLELPYTVEAAKITSDHALKFGVIGSELSAAATYKLSCQWAEAFNQAGFNGVWYMPRFSGPSSRALAVFGNAGPTTEYDADSTPKPLKTVIDEMIDLHVMQIPQSTAELEILDTPQV